MKRGQHLGEAKTASMVQNEDSEMSATTSRSRESSSTVTKSYPTFTLTNPTPIPDETNHRESQSNEAKGETLDITG